MHSVLPSPPLTALAGGGEKNGGPFENMNSERDHPPRRPGLRAGTHNHRRVVVPKPSNSVSQHEGRGVWVPARRPGRRPPCWRLSALSPSTSLLLRLLPADRLQLGEHGVD